MSNLEPSRSAVTHHFVEGELVWMQFHALCGNEHPITLGEMRCCCGDDHHIDGYICCSCGHFHNPAAQCLPSGAVRILRLLHQLKGDPVTTAYVQTNPQGRLDADSTITVDGNTYPIPERGWYGDDRKPSRAAPHRIAAALESAGYEPRYTPVGEPDENGRFEIEVVKA